MNLYLRLIWTLLRCWRLPSLNINSELERRFRVLPNDIDINAHINNGRYLTILDLMLVEYLEKTFNISFEPHEVTAEHLDSLNIIEAFVHQKQVGAKAA